MTNGSPKTTPIALAVVGASIIVGAVSAYAFGQNVDSFLTLIVIIAILIGIVAISLCACLYYWERSEYYRHPFKFVPPPIPILNFPSVLEKRRFGKTSISNLVLIL